MIDVKEGNDIFETDDGYRIKIPKCCTCNKLPKSFIEYARIGMYRWFGFSCAEKVRSCGTVTSRGCNFEDWEKEDGTLIAPSPLPNTIKSWPEVMDYILSSGYVIKDNQKIKYLGELMQLDPALNKMIIDPVRKAITELYEQSGLENPCQWAQKEEAHV